MCAKKASEVCLQPVFAKKVLKANKKVGKLTKGVPDLISYATELFVLDLVKRSTQDGTSDLRADDIAQLIQSTPEYAFLLPLLPKLQEASVEEGTKKRRPTSS
jgi:hypothetical protein